MPFALKLGDRVLTNINLDLSDQLFTITKLPPNPSGVYELSSCILALEEDPFVARRGHIFRPEYEIGDPVEIAQKDPTAVRLFGVVKRVMLKNGVNVVYDVEVEVGEKKLKSRG